MYTHVITAHPFFYTAVVVEVRTEQWMGNVVLVITFGSLVPYGNKRQIKKIEFIQLG